MEKPKNDVTYEKRILIEDSEMRIDSSENEKEPKITGYAAKFNKLSQDLGGFREKIDPGAFKKAIRKDDVRMLFNHDPNFVIARTENKTLKLKEDDTGLRIEAKPAGTQWANDLLVSIDRGDIDQMSFGFVVEDEEWEYNKKDTVRTLKQVALRDVSAVTYPAYLDTEVQLRTMEANNIDFNTIKQILIRLEYGIQTEDDKKALENYYERIIKMFPSEGEPKPPEDNNIAEGTPKRDQIRNIVWDILTHKN